LIFALRNKQKPAQSAIISTNAEIFNNPLALTTIVTSNNKSHYENTVTNIKELKMTLWK
ncbi:15586_t:CDS:1, partial [Gigaspora rosea]